MAVALFHIKVWSIATQRSNNSGKNIDWLISEYVLLLELCIMYKLLNMHFYAVHKWAPTDMYTSMWISGNWYIFL